MLRKTLVNDLNRPDMVEFFTYVDGLETTRVADHNQRTVPLPTKLHLAGPGRHKCGRGSDIFRVNRLIDVLTGRNNNQEVSVRYPRRMIVTIDKKRQRLPIGARSFCRNCIRHLRGLTAHEDSKQSEATPKR